MVFNPDSHWHLMEASLNLFFFPVMPILAVPKENAMDKAIRILVANRPKLMRELLLATLSEQAWIEVVGEVAEASDLSDCVDKTAPDLIVIDAEEPGKRPHICDTLLRQHPQLRIIAVAPQENYSVCYWASFDIHSDDVEASEEGFLSAVRKVADCGATGALN
jgi:chemotaxis response regulator CheB